MAAASTASIFIRFAQASAPSLVIAAYRLTIASAVLAPLLFTHYRSDLKAMSRRQIGLALASGAFLALHFAAWITSLEHTSVASSVVLVSTAPLFVAVLAPLLLAEPTAGAVFAGLGLSLGGTLVVGLSDACTWQAGLHCDLAAAAGGVQGDLLALVGAAALAVYMLIGRRLRAELALVPYIGLTYSSAAVTLIAAALVARLPATGYPAATYLWFALLALIPQLVAHSTYNWALRYLSAAYVSVTLLGEPVGSTILAYLILGERPPALRLAGAILILAGIVFASRGSGAAPQPGASRAGSWRNIMQVRCYACGWSFGIKNDEMAFALKTLEESKGGHYDVQCPRCKKANKVSLEQLRRAAPRRPAPESGGKEPSA